MQDLIDRVTAAIGPDRDLDVAILTGAFGYRDINGDGSMFDRGNDGYWSIEGDERNARLPAPTASVDAALALLPHIDSLSSLSRRTQPEMGGRMWSASVKTHTHIHSGGQRTAALAICAAALKARIAR
jgi:hypothetical protein